MKLEHILIFGVNGGFGKLFSKRLAAEGIAVSGVDLAESGAATLEHPYHQSDLSKLDPEVSKQVENCDALLICLPERVAFKAIEIYASALSKDALLVDTLSVKGPVREKSKQVSGEFSWLSINPMCAPDLCFQDQNVGGVIFSQGKRVQIFTDLLEAWGAKVSILSASEHDRITAITQVATHAAILAFGKCMREWEGYPGESAKLSTPLSRTMMALCKRMASNDPDVYWRIQSDNREAEKVREQLRRSFQELFEAVDQGDREAFVGQVLGSLTGSRPRQRAEA